jgi:hypothetical protein
MEEMKTLARQWRVATGVFAMPFKASVLGANKEAQAEGWSYRDRSFEEEARADVSPLR